MNKVLAVSLVLLLNACVSTNATILNPTPVQRAAVPVEQVRIYRTAAQVTGKYEEIALLNSTGESNWTNEKNMLESMRAKAGKLGANGVILEAVNEASSGAKVAAAVLGTGTQRKGRSIAIFVFPDSATKTP